MILKSPFHNNPSTNDTTLYSVTYFFLNLIILIYFLFDSHKNKNKKYTFLKVYLIFIIKRICVS